MNQLSHFNNQGEAHMVDISEKQITKRKAVTFGKISMLKNTFDLIESKGHKKGDVLAIARVAGIMASKQTANLIPLCHPLSITHVAIDLKAIANERAIHCFCTIETDGKTGVEMEALTATQITLLTIYDMCKAIDRAMVISEVKLLEKSGGKSGHWIREKNT